MRAGAWASRLSILALTVLLGGCGGGVGSGGTGDVAGGYGVGTITGFGSVIVDGERYEDSGARFEYDSEEGAPDRSAGALTRADLAVGQRVELEFEAEGAARRAQVFRVSPTLVGPVTNLAPLQVAGQTVHVVQGESRRGPDTRFGEGLASAAQIALGERLEVHGVLAPDGLAATLIRRLPPSQGRWTRLSGTVSELSADGRSFRLGAWIVDMAEPARVTTPLRNGQRVRVWTREPAQGNRALAERVRAERPSLRALQAVRLSGIATACPERDRNAYLCIGAVPVALAGAAFGPGLEAGTLEGRYVVVSGRHDTAADALGAARFELPPSR